MANPLKKTLYCKIYDATKRLDEGLWSISFLKGFCYLLAVKGFETLHIICISFA